MSIADALTRISQIQAQMTGLTQGAPSAVSSTTGGVAAGQAADGGGSFAAALAQAQGPPAAAGGGAIGAGLASDVGALGPTDGSLTYGAQLPASGYAGGLAPLAGLSGPAGLAGTAMFAGAAIGGAGGAGAPLPAAAARLLTPAQQAFASRLASRTGLDPQVVSAWLLAEESGSAAQSRQSQGNNDWLNIGYTDSGTYGAGDGVWSDPVSAADATAGWLKGQNTIPGYGTASSGVQGILATAGQAAQSQVSAIQASGWASSGYPDLPSLLAQVSA